MSHKNLIDVAVELPLNKIFTYRVPDTLSDQIGIGKRVLAPFGKGIITGFCLGFKEKSDVRDLKDIFDVLDDEPLFDEKRLKLFQWMSYYYFAPLGEVLSLAAPAVTGIKSQRIFFVQKQESEGSPRVLLVETYKSEKTNLPAHILEVIKQREGISLTSLAKIFKGKSIYSAINKLKQDGFIREELKIKGRIGERVETFVSMKTPQFPTSLTLQHIYENLKTKSPLQAKIIAYLSEKGETPLKILKKELGGIDSAIKRLEQKGLITLEQRKVLRNPLEDILPQSISHKPTDEQEKALHTIFHGLKNNAFAPFLLYGVTGSGKTFVYLKTLEQAAALGKQTIFLVPEISLTTWPVKYLTAMFPDRVAVLHSGLSDGERYDEWNRIKQGKVDVVIGARSALFAPLKNLGLIIVDEEHESSYKQEEGVRYHARDVSLMMGKMLNLTVVLGSATPSLETFQNAKNGKITLLRLTRRLEHRPMPAVEIVDMKKQGPGTRGKGEKDGSPFTVHRSHLSERLRNLMTENLSLGYQTILFLNRRGFSNFLICADCGHTFMCPNCSVSLTLHKGAGLLKCHYCDLSAPLPEICPTCKRSQMKPIGIGTEQLEAEVRKLFPKIRVARMDRDTTRKKRAHQRILDAVSDKKVDILVGTQMVAKGHHFPDVTLVGIISADTSLHIPDFRSAERTFQLITQAAGRAGRGDVPGKVIIQTFNTGNDCLTWAAQQNYEGFFEEELLNRQGLLYPPFSRLVNLKIEGNKEKDVKETAETIKILAENMLNNGLKKDITILGPAPAFLSRLKGKHRYQMLVKAKDTKSQHEFTEKLLKGFEGKKQKRVRLVVDIDPMTTI